MYNQILLGPDCLCSRLLLGLKKKCAPKVICSFSAGCSCRAERWKSHFSVDSVILFFFPSILFLSPCVFSLQVRNGIVNLAHSVRRLNRQQCRCHSCHSYTWFHSNTSAHPLLCFFSSQIIWKQRSLQRLWSVHSSQWTGDEGAGQRVPSQGKLEFKEAFNRIKLGMLHVINSVDLVDELLRAMALPRKF